MIRGFSTSIVSAAPPVTGVEVDAANAVFNPGGHTATITISSNPDQCIFVHSHVGVSGAIPAIPPTCTVGGQSATLLFDASHNDGGWNYYDAIHYLVNPPTGGSVSISCSWDVNDENLLGAYCAYNVDQANPVAQFDSTNTYSSGTTSVSDTLTGVLAGSAVAQACLYGVTAGGVSFTPGANQTFLYATNKGNYYDDIGGSFEESPSGGTVTMSASWSGTGISATNYLYEIAAS